MGQRAGRTSELAEGVQIAGRYRVQRLLGQGGMGAVYAAVHTELGREVALKTLLPREDADDVAARRLLREARAAAGIGHPGIVDVYDLIEHQGTTFVVMERLHGEDLHQRIVDSSPLPIPFVVRMGVEVSEAIAAAHAHGIIHRDLKPRNVFVARDARLGEVFKVLDFGVAALVEDAEAGASTHSGHVAGTPAYMAPERLAGARGDALVDVYAIGALLYEALTRQPPFSGASYAELVLRISSEEPRPVAELRPDAPAPLVALIERALHKDPAQRPQSAAVLAHELRVTELPAGGDSGIVPTRPRLTSSTRSVRVPGTRSPGERRGGWGPLGRRVAMPALALTALAALAAVAVWARGEGARHGVQPANAQADRPRDRELAAATPPADPRQVAAALPAQSEPSRRVEVDSSPPGATLWLDGEPRCDAPCAVEVAAGEHSLEARLEGYRPVRRALRSPLPERLSLRLPARESARHKPAARASEEPLPPLLPR